MFATYGQRGIFGQAPIYPAFDPSLLGGDASTPIGNGFSLSPIAPANQAPTLPGAIQRPNPIGIRNARQAPVDMRPMVGAPGGDTPVSQRPTVPGGMFAAPPSILGQNGGAPIAQSLAANQALGQQKADHRHKVMGDVAGGIAAAINGYLAAMNNPAGIEGLRSMHEAQMEKQREAAAIEQERQKALLPQQVGDSLVQPDGSGGYQTIFRDPQPFEAYAQSLGYQPGTPEYTKAIEDYRLNAWSDPAVAAKRDLTGYRYDRSDAQLGRRLYVTERGQDLTHGDRQDSIHQSDVNNRRSTGTSAANNLRSTTTSHDNSVRANATRQGAYGYSHGGGHGHASDGPVAVGPDGKRYTVRNGQWVPIQ